MEYCNWTIPSYTLPPKHWHCIQ